VAIGDSFDVVFRVERETAYKEESSWGAYRVVPITNNKQLKTNKYGEINIKGIMPQMEYNSVWSAKIKESQTHPVYGTSYTVEKIWQERPSTPEQQKAFLKQFIPDRLVFNIFHVYDENEDIVAMFENDTFDYKKVVGFGEVNYQMYKKKIIENKELREAIEELSEFGLNFSQVKRIVANFDSIVVAVDMIKKNPYLLVKYVHGFGFRKVDEIALKNGYDREGQHRIQSCIFHVLGEVQQEGHSYIMRKELIKRCVGLLDVDEGLIHNELNNDMEDIIIIDDRVAFKRTYETEKYIAKRLDEIQANSYELNIDIDKFLDEYEAKNDFKLTEEQRSFFHAVKSNNVVFLVGYGGTGKSQLQKILLALLNEVNLSIRLLAPTGKAAKIQEEYTGHPSSTIHRAIGIFGDDSDACGRIFDDVVLVDETSMLDIFICRKLLKSLSNPKVKLIFVGDAFQLPAVGVGSFLYHNLEAKKYPIVELTQVFRQKDGGILDIATKVRLGEKFIDSNFSGKKMFGKDALLHAIDQQFVEKGYQFYYQQALKKYAKEDIMVLSPTNKGKLGTDYINKTIQNIVNPPSNEKKELPYGKDMVFRVGDNVINIKNTYKVIDQNGDEVDIMNGDMGKIIDIDNGLIIDYDFAIVRVSYDNLSNIKHSYCLTTFKAQGSGAKCVIIIQDKSHKYQHNANLLYTAITRSKELCIIVGQAETINYAMRKNATLARNNFLIDFLNNDKNNNI
jgi:RecD/TraA family predicted helicase